MWWRVGTFILLFHSHNCSSMQSDVFLWWFEIISMLQQAWSYLMSPLRSYIITPDIHVPSSSHCIINSKVKMSTSDICYRLQLRIQMVWDVFTLGQNWKPLNVSETFALAVFSSFLFYTKVAFWWCKSCSVKTFLHL